MEQKIGWTQLIRIRNQVFLERNEVPLGEIGNTRIRKRRSCVPREKDGSDSEESKSQHSGTTEEDYDSKEKKSSEEVSGSRPEGTSFVKKSVFHKNKVYNEGKRDEETDNTQKIKRICEKLDNALSCLKDDLAAYYYWESEETKKDDTLVHKYGGRIWIYRGMLAERLSKMKMAERAYRRVISKGFSLFVWSRLLEFYTIANNLRASIACIAEVLDYFTDELGIIDYPRGLPAWMQEALFKLIAKNGVELVESAIQQESCGQAAVINRVVEKAKARKIHIAG